MEGERAREHEDAVAVLTREHEKRAGDGYDRNEDHLAQCCELVGALAGEAGAELARNEAGIGHLQEMSAVQQLRHAGSADCLALSSLAQPGQNMCVSMPQPFRRQRCCVPTSCAGVA